MAGTFGLTEVGQELDRYVTAMTDRKTANRITTFVVKLTKRLQWIREFNDEFTLMLYRKHYREEVEKRFGSLEAKPLILGYIHSLTKPKFVPTTRTQEALRRKVRVTPSAWGTVANFFGFTLAEGV